MSNTVTDIVTIDVPGANYLEPTGINSAGTVVGYYSVNTTEIPPQGFIDNAGTITTLDAPGAAGTEPAGINDGGTIVGSYFDISATAHGFIDVGGTFTTFDVTGAQDTFAGAINASGEIIGAFDTDGNAADLQGFIYDGGTITTIDIPGASFVNPFAINTSGEIVGWVTISGRQEGFLDNAGSITLLNIPGSSGIFPYGINASGEVVGYYTGADNLARGFVYNDGTYSSIIGVGTDQTLPTNINDAGQITGNYEVGTVEHAFVYTIGNPDSGALFDAPGATGTDPSGINSAGEIIGPFTDAAYNVGGFEANASGAAGTAILQSDILPGLACYVAGTRIATDHGEVAVENLRPGDRVVSVFGGTVPVIWIGHRAIDCRHHPRPHEVWPIRVCAHAFAENQPRRDLFLSPDHAVFVDNAFIPVRCLVNDLTVRQVGANAVTYFHVEVPMHDVLLADGLPAESYLDTGNRGHFANGGAVSSLHPNFALEAWQSLACAPQVTHGPALARVSKRLRARAGGLSESGGIAGRGEQRPPSRRLSR